MLYKRPAMRLPNACRLCGATSYRRVIERDDAGAMRPTGLYSCSGCSVVFANPAMWRDGGADEVPGRVPAAEAPDSAKTDGIKPLGGPIIHQESGTSLDATAA